MPTPTKTPDTTNLGGAAAAAGVAGAGVLWFNGAGGLSGWALRHGYFTTSHWYPCSPPPPPAPDPPP